MDTIMTLTPWHWLILGMVLFALETLGSGGFLLGIALASVTTSIVTWLGFNWHIQLISFALLSVAFSIAYWKYFKSFNLDRPGNPVINEKMESLKGKTGKVVRSDGEAGGKVQIGDTLWEFRSSEIFSEGDRIIVESYEEMTLHVKAL